MLNLFRSDKTRRVECAAIYEAMGMDLNTAFRMFMEGTRMVRGLLFHAVSPEKQITRTEPKEKRKQCYRRSGMKLRISPK